MLVVAPELLQSHVSLDCYIVKRSNELGGWLERAVGGGIGVEVIVCASRSALMLP